MHQIPDRDTILEMARRMGGFHPASEERAQQDADISHPPQPEAEVAPQPEPPKAGKKK
jgi:hypothetical protein